MKPSYSVGLGFSLLKKLVQLRLAFSVLKIHFEVRFIFKLFQNIHFVDSHWAVL